MSKAAHVELYEDLRPILFAGELVEAEWDLGHLCVACLTDNTIAGWLLGTQDYVSDAQSKDDLSPLDGFVIARRDAMAKLYQVADDYKHTRVTSVHFVYAMTLIVPEMLAQLATWITVAARARYFSSGHYDRMKVVSERMSDLAFLAKDPAEHQANVSFEAAEWIAVMREYLSSTYYPYRRKVFDQLSQSRAFNLGNTSLFRAFSAHACYERQAHPFGVGRQSRCQAAEAYVEWLAKWDEREA